MASTDETFVQLLRQHLKRVGVDLEDAGAMLRAAQGRVQDLEAEQIGLTLTLKRYGQAAAVSVQAPPAMATSDPQADADTHHEPAVPEAQKSNTDWAFEALQALSRPASHHEVGNKATEMGAPDFTSEKARNALTYLKKKGRVKRQPSGLWEVAAREEAAPDNDSVPAVNAGANGTSAGNPFLAGMAIPAGVTPGAN